MLARLDEWLLGPDDTGWVVITGGPGMGKSALPSKWLDRREAAGAAPPHHFVRRQVIDWDQRARRDAIGDPWTGLRAELGSLARAAAVLDGLG